MATTITGLGEGIFDYGAMFISSGNLTKTGLHPTSGILVRGTGLKGSAARIFFPSSSGTYERVLMEIHGSVDDSTYRLVATYPGGYQSWATGSGKAFNLPFTLPKGMKYAKLKFTLANNTTNTSGYGAVKAGIVPRVDGPWSRAVDWS